MSRYPIFVKFILIIFFVSISIIHAQPYKYFFSGHWKNRSISRINVETGVTEDVLTDCGIGLQLFTTSDQEKIIYTDRALVYALDMNDLENKITLMSKTRDDEVLQILDAPKTNRLYLVFGDVDQVPRMTIVFHRQTFAHIDTLYGVYSYNQPFLSRDETKIFKLISDKEGIYFSVMSTTGVLLMEKEKCGSLGNFIFNTRLIDSKDGFAVVIFGYQKGHENKYYVLCDLEQNINYSPIHFPWRSKAYLSSDAKKVIFEEVQFIKDDDPNTPVEYRPGNIYIFDAKTAVLKRRLKLPPEGELLLFDHYPEKIYYYRPNVPEDPLSVDLSQEQSDTELISILVDDLQDAYEKGWIVDQMTVDKYINYLTTVQSYIEQNENKLAENILQTVLNEIEEDTGIKITNEGQLLLYSNLKYLLDKIMHSEVSIDDLIEYINTQFEQGTIDTPGIANSLIAKLETAQKQLEKEKPKQAVNALNAFLNELNAQQGKHLSDEVYNYLKKKVEELIVQIE